MGKWKFLALGIWQHWELAICHQYSSAFPHYDGLSFAGNADHTNKLNDKAIKSHGIGLRCIIVIFAVVVVIIVIILLDSMDVLSHCDTY